MTRGRDRSVSNERVLAEILLQPDRAVFASEIAAEVPVSRARIRQICQELAADDYVAIESVPNGNIYRLTEPGVERVAAAIRDTIA